MVRIPHLDLPTGENMTIHLYNRTPMMLGLMYNLTAAADVLSGADWTEIETDNNAMTKRVIIEEGGFGNQTGPRGTGGGGAGMFSLTEWIMKCCLACAAALHGLGYRMEQRSYGRVRVSWGMQ